MRNYYDVLGMDRLTPSTTLKKILGSFSREELADEDDLQAILENDKWRGHYRRMHLQYDAIAAVLTNPAVTGSQPDNSHHWDKRTVEFEPVQNTIELSPSRPNT